MRKVLVQVPIAILIASMASRTIAQDVCFDDFDPRLNEYVIFGDSQVTIQSLPFPSQINGNVGSNGGMLIGAGALINGDVKAGNSGLSVKKDTVINGNVMVDGNFSTFANVTINGDVICSGNVTLGNEAEVNGNICSEKNITIGADSVVDGDVIADGNVDVRRDVTVTGLVKSGQRRVVIGRNSVVGDVEFCADFRAGAGAVWASATEVCEAVDCLPDDFLPLADIGPADGICGDATCPFGSDVDIVDGDVVTLPPGSYGALRAGSEVQLTLVSGDYSFTSVNIGNESDIIFDVTGGPIRVFTAGDTSIGQQTVSTVVGGIAADVFWQTCGVLFYASAGDGTAAGIFWAPQNTLHIGRQNRFGPTAAHSGQFWGAEIFMEPGVVERPPEGGCPLVCVSDCFQIAQSGNFEITGRGFAQNGVDLLVWTKDAVQPVAGLDLSGNTNCDQLFAELDIGLVDPLDDNSEEFLRAPLLINCLLNEGFVPGDEFIFGLRVSDGTSSPPSVLLLPDCVFTLPAAD